MTTRYSLLDLATVEPASGIARALADSVRLARKAEELGYHRVWYAEHHNFASIASSATAVLIAHVAAHTERIRLGSGGIMLPNHAPLVIAEQFGTLASLHPDRIDLGLGRAPGTDQTTMRALRRSPESADTFPEDVLELQGYLGDASRVPGVQAVPGRGTRVPLYLLGSSLFGAQLAARLGLPYAFASHFAPQALQDAIAVYRARFQPSEQLQEPYAMAAVNVIAADSAEEAEALRQAALVARMKSFFGKDGRIISDHDAEAILHTPQGANIAQMAHYTAVGTGDEVRDYLHGFAEHADADELITVHSGVGIEARLRSLELTAQAVGLAAG